MLIEIKSKVFSEKILNTLTQLVEGEVKKMQDRVQVSIKNFYFYMYKMINQIIYLMTEIFARL